MNPTARKLLILCLLCLSLSPMIALIPHYGDVYAILEPYHVEGLWVCWTGAYVLANLCAPGFMQGAGNRGDYENSGPRTLMTLYYSVMIITFLALAAVFLVLWCLGWVWYWVGGVLYWLIESSVNWIVDLLFGMIGLT